MNCPHCRVEFHDAPEGINLGIDVDGGWFLILRTCPACSRFVIELVSGYPNRNSEGHLVSLASEYVRYLVRPKVVSRRPCPNEVPTQYAEDYKEACCVIGDSTKASAALSRRCLQNLLRGVAKVKPGNLADEIQEAIQSGTLPPHIVQAIDAVRNIGNFAAHPIKSQKSGEILDVEPGEAEWNLDVLEALFDFYFVSPALMQNKKDALDRKLGEAGKKPMK